MSAPLGIVLSDDLLFSSRITGTARAHACTMKIARSPAVLHQMLQQEKPTCVIVDLGNPGLDLAELVRRLDELEKPRPRLIAYGSHVDADMLRQARQAGCDLVLPRSQFVADLEHKLPEWLAG
jgi:CheY-like chemotaxis protein